MFFNKKKVLSALKNKQFFWYFSSVLPQEMSTLSKSLACLSPATDLSSAAAAATSVSALIATWPGVRASSLSDRSTRKQEKSVGSSVSLDRNMFEIAKKTKLNIMQNRHENNLNAKSNFFQNRSLLKERL